MSYDDYPESRLSIFTTFITNVKLAEWQYEQYGSMVKYSKEILIYKLYSITWTSDGSSQFKCSSLARV